MSDEQLGALLASMDQANEEPGTPPDESAESRGDPSRSRIIGAALLVVAAVGIVLAIPGTWPRIAQGPASLGEPPQESPMKFRTAAAALLTASAANAGTLLVPQQFGTIQQAIDSASNSDVIQVSAGTYHEQVNLSGKAIELVGVDGAGATFIDGDNQRTVIVGSGEPAGCVVRGFTIQHGHAGGYYGGAGMSVAGSSVSVIDCVFRENRATGYQWWGTAGFRSEGGSPTVERCLFTRNEIAPTENLHGSSAVFHYRGGSIVVRDCKFIENTTTRIGGTGDLQYSRVLKIHSEFSPTVALVTGCLFLDQRCAGLIPTHQAEIESYYSDAAVAIEDCTFVSSHSTESVVYTGDGATIHASAACGYDSIATPWTFGLSVTATSFLATCADCNENGFADIAEIATGTASDVNGDGVPDACVSDCNSDGIPDSTQLAAGQLADFDGSGVPDCCERGEACVVGSYPVQWRIADGGNGHWYRLIADPLSTWDEARAAALRDGGDLASIASASENRIVFAIGRTSWIGEWAGPWIGGKLTSAGWQWSDGTPWGFTAWDCANPSNTGGYEDRLHYAVNGACSSTPIATWNDAFSGGIGSGGLASVIEWSTDCSNDGIVDYGQILNGEFADINRNGVPDRICECLGDLYVDGFVNGADLGALLAYWGPVTGTPASQAADIDRDGVVNGSDLGILLAGWGACAP